MPAYNIVHSPRGPSAFKYRDPEGAPSNDGHRYHAALDWFAKGNAPVFAAAAGTVVEAKPSRGNRGQVFGGTVKIQTASGKVCVYRHVEPRVEVGDKVKQGKRIAYVTDWLDGPSHVHFEVWKTLEGGYDFENMIDPASLSWTSELRPPATLGRTLRLSLHGETFAGWAECKNRLRWIAVHGLDRANEDCALAFEKEVVRGADAVTRKAREIVRTYLTTT